MYGNVRLARFLLQQGVARNEKDLSGDTPLLLAFQFGQLDVVKELVKHGKKDSVFNTAREKEMKLILAHRRRPRARSPAVGNGFPQPIVPC